MEIWVRSQDRKNLIKINALYTDIPSDFGQEGFGVYCDKRDSYVSNTLLKIGQYKTKERTLEVLDEIQELIKPKTLINVENFNTNNARVLCDKFKEYSPVIVGNDNIKIEPLGFIVYEMPKE